MKPLQPKPPKSFPKTYRLPFDIYERILAVTAEAEKQELVFNPTEEITEFWKTRLPELEKQLDIK